MTHVITAVFSGFLADLKGHKENTEWKGYNGNVCCLSCLNIDKRLSGDDGSGVYGLDCSDPALFVERTSADVFNTVDELVDLKATTSKSKFEEHETNRGFNLVLQGLLLDLTLRSLYKPVEHTIRDWMHTLCSDGVANSVCGEALQELGRYGFSLQVVRDFMAQVHLPSKYGKTHQDWLRDSRLKTHQLTSFASVILSVVPILYLFMCQYCADIDDLADVFECVQLMHMVLGILSAGPEKPMKYLATMKVLIPKLHATFVRCWDKLKPKIHHMHHIIDGMEWCGKLLSCFVTERKHRTVKKNGSTRDALH